MQASWELTWSNRSTALGMEQHTTAAEQFAGSGGAATTEESEDGMLQAALELGHDSDWH